VPYPIGLIEKCTESVAAVRFFPKVALSSFWCRLFDDPVSILSAALVFPSAKLLVTVEEISECSHAASFISLSPLRSFFRPNGMRERV